ncbi:phosphoribosylanthranilate isomerase [Pseudogracilibacillus sp. SE30717A]|uniref:phosphoribosylanthranilate isomerase n=1 Tax=Pseudogracilibacillus sp. SE30717A TaxID=3098293 RepID=UPI00300DD093
MFVKICGVTSLETAKVVQNAGADFIGFVFAPSKRRIAPVKAAEIAKHLSPSLKKVGVFVNESLENIKLIANLVGLDYIQLHGDEPKQLATKIPYPIIKAFSIDQVDAATIQDYPYDYLLIDSPGETFRGGSGNTFNWKKLNELKIDRRKLLLAGGLNINNIKEAIDTVHPIGVDVSSGVETDGVKDHEKIHQFIQQATYETI